MKILRGAPGWEGGALEISSFEFQHLHSDPHPPPPLAILNGLSLSSQLQQTACTMSVHIKVLKLHVDLCSSHMYTSYSATCGV